MLPETFLKNDELVQEFLETDALEKSRTRQRAHIDAQKIKRYLKIVLFKVKVFAGLLLISVLKNPNKTIEET